MILDTIVQDKKIRLEQRKKKVSEAQMRNFALETTRQKKENSLRKNHLTC